jgi:dCMP deaminase
VLVNQHKHVIATGYNGVAVGVPHCNLTVGDKQEGWDRLVKPKPTHPHACPGALAASGTNLDGCHAIHAEQNALLQCKNVHEIVTAYVTASPCTTCIKLLLNTSCQEIVFLEAYPHSAAQDLWEAQGRRWTHGQA